MTAAFKEWALVVDAMGGGEQIFILRKGGIHEGRGGFQMEHQEFALFPTLFHQQKEGVIEAAGRRFDEIAPTLQASNSISIEYIARVVEWHHLSLLQDLHRLSGQHIWREELLAERFEWGRNKGIFAIAVRVYRLPAALELPMLPEYGGCKSWITLAHEINPTEAVPVLAEKEFAEKLERFRAALLPASHAQTGLPLILASASPRRSELLRELAVAFDVIPSDAEEIHDETMPPAQVCETNAWRKAMGVAQKYPGRVILGADTLVFHQGKVFGKPKNIAEARSMLEQLSGATHQVITGVAVVHLASGREELYSEVTEVTFRSLSAAAIEDYLSKVQVLDKAGAYAVQEHGEMLVERLAGSRSNVVGLPSERVKETLVRWGLLQVEAAPTDGTPQAFGSKK